MGLQVLKYIWMIFHFFSLITEEKYLPYFFFPFLFSFFLSYRVTGFSGLELCDSTKYEKQTVK